MSDLRDVIVISDGPVKDAAGIHGKDIGYIYASGNVQLTVDYSLLEDGWVPIVNPNPWKNSKVQGWIKWSRIHVDDPKSISILVTYNSDGTVTAKVVG